MARRDGCTPMYRARQRANVFATIEPKDGGAVRLREWSGSSCKSVKRAARAAYPDAYVSFGKCFWRTV